jgi:branched-chain amino acid transport system substrate-binding protein
VLRCRGVSRAFLAAVAVALAGLGCRHPVGEQGISPRPRDQVEPLVQAPEEIHAGDALPIAAIFPTLGRYAVSGLQSLQGARLAVEDLNRAGGVSGRPLRLAEYRTGSFFTDAREAAAMAARDGVLAIVGSNSSELSQAVAEEADAHGVVQITNVSTAADLTWDPQTGRTRPFVFRMCATDDVMGALLAGFARDRLDAHRVAILYEVGRTYSQRLARSFEEHFRDEANGRVVAEFFYLALETDFLPQLRRIKEFHPDVIFLPGSFPDATLVAVQERMVGLKTTLLGGDAWSSPLLFQRGAPPGEAYYVELCSPAPEFDRRYAEAEGAAPPGCRAVLAYDAVQVIAQALRTLGPLSTKALTSGLEDTRRRLRDAIADGAFDGVTGRIRFDAHGDRRQGVALYAVEPGPQGPRALVRGWLGEP